MKIIMKKFYFINLLVLSLLIGLSSCKKEEVSLEEPELSITNNSNRDWVPSNAVILGFNEMYISGKLAPEDVTNDEVIVKISSNADPEGFEITLPTTFSSQNEGKIKYLFHRFSGTVSAANHTDAEKKKIKVSEYGDTISITIGDDIITKTIAFYSDEKLTYTFYNFSFSAVVFLNGYYYEGTENKSIDVWSTRDNQVVIIEGEWVDPSIYQGLPAFSRYKFDILLNDGWSYPADNMVGIYPFSELDPDGDTIFIKYNDKTYYTVYTETVTGPLQQY